MKSFKNKKGGLILVRIKTMVVCVFIFVLFLFALPCFSIVSYIIKLQMQPMSVHSNDFYIKKVLDGRSNRSNIGFIQAGVTNYQVPAYLDGDFVEVFQTYFNLNFPVDNGKIPIIIVIDRLRVSEREQFSGEYARAEIKMEFFKTANNKVGKVFETEVFSDIRSGWDVTKYHEVNIRSAIEKCLSSFINSKWNTIEVNWVEQSTFENTLERLQVF